MKHYHKTLKNSLLVTALGACVTLPTASATDAEDFDRNFGEYIVIDTEATGLGNEHELTEVAAVKVQNMQPTGEKFHVYLKNSGVIVMKGKS